MRRQPRALTTDEHDFMAMMDHLKPRLGAFAYKKLQDGLHPKDIVTQIEQIAQKARGWCVGRYGHGA